MKSKGIIAIIVVLILVAAGVGAGVYLAKNSDNTPTVDKVKDKIEVGDYITFNSDIVMNSMETTSIENFTAELYSDPGSVGPEEPTIKYKDKEYKCLEIDYLTEYNDEVRAFVIPENGFILQKITKYSDDIIVKHTLVDTSSDINVELSQEDLIKNVKEGSFYKYDIEQTGSTGTVTKVLKEYVSQSDVKIQISENSSNLNVTKEVTAINGDKLVLNDKSTVTKNNFLSSVSKDAWIEFQKESGINYESKTKTNDTISTPFGDRDITREIMECATSTGLTYSSEILYGSEGFVYKITTAEIMSGGSIQTTETLVKTSMRA